MNLPGEEEVKKLGYTLNFYEASLKSAVYTKDGVHLDISEKEGLLTARLVCYYKLVAISSPEFPFPNKNFSVFEGQILEVKGKMGT